MINLNDKDPTGIIWIASYPRSGNTWTRAFLTCLFGIMADPSFEDVNINHLEEGYAAENAAALYPRFLGKPVFQASQREIAAARPWVQAALARSAGRPVYLKTHNARGVDYGHPLINTTVSLGAIYIVRNPLDVAISYARFSNVPIDTMIQTMATSGWGIPTTEKKVRTVTGSWSENVRTWTDVAHPAVLVVRYEDMIERPEQTFSRMARHVRVQPSQTQLRRAVEMTVFDRLRERETVAGFKERPDTADRFFREGRAGQWRDVLSAHQVVQIVADHKAQMRRFRYLPGKA